MKTCFLLVAAVAAAAFASARCSPAQAATPTPPPTTTIDIAATCQAAHDADSRVSATFCSTRLRGSFAPDTCYLADDAAAEGARNANNARREIAAAMQRQEDGGEQGYDPIYWSVLERCEGFYGVVRERYDAARLAIKEQRYGDVEEELSSVPSSGQSCDDEFALALRGGASPFVRYTEDNTQLALLTIAITSLIK